MAENYNKKTFSRNSSDIVDKYKEELMKLYKKNPAADMASSVKPVNVAPTTPTDKDEAQTEQVPLQVPVPIPELELAPKPKATPMPPTVINNPDMPKEIGSPDEVVFEDARPGESSIGFLMVRATTGSQAIPIEDAHITVYSEAGDESRLHHVMTTDSSGETQTIQLPTPPMILSQSPGNPRPFSQYTVLTSKEGFYPVKNINVAVFANTRSILPVSLVPWEEFPRNPENPQVFIGQEPNL